MGNVTKVDYDTTRNTRWGLQIAQKVFKLVLTSLCDPQEYAHSFTREQKIAVLWEMESILRTTASFVRTQLESLDGNMY